MLLVLLTFAVGRPTSQVFFSWQPCAAGTFAFLHIELVMKTEIRFF